MISRYNSNHRKAARRIQAECGVGYQQALNWVEDHYEDIFQMILKDNDSPDWRSWKSAATSLWRQLETNDE